MLIPHWDHLWQGLGCSVEERRVPHQGEGSTTAAYLDPLPHAWYKAETWKRHDKKGKIAFVRVLPPQLQASACRAAICLGSCPKAPRPTEAKSKAGLLVFAMASCEKLLGSCYSMNLTSMS